MRLALFGVAVVLAASAGACGANGHGAVGEPVNRTPSASGSPHSIAIPMTQGQCIVPVPVTPPEHPLTVVPKIGCWAVDLTDLEFPLAVFNGPVMGRYTWESGGVADDDTGKAVIGARVQLSAPTLSRPLTAITDSRGQYAFLNVPLARYRCIPVTVRVRARGYVPIRIGPEATFRGAGQRSITISKTRTLSDREAGCHAR